MENRMTTIAGGALSALALSGMAAGAALAAEAPAQPETSQPAAVEEAAQGSAWQTVHADAAQGTFSFDQATLTPNGTIATTFRPAAKALCSATDDFIQANPLEWQISVTGEVGAAFTAPVDELASESAVKQTMTCTCGGNPADGRAIATADVRGIPVSYLLDRAEAPAGSNALTFVSADGAEVTLPLSWVVARHGVISYEVNGEGLSASVGGNNQLWLAGAPANLFVRDVVEVRVESLPEPPADPSESAEYPNSPNVGLLGVEVGA